ncbi:four helix bundle protein [Candidatus Uhrbacteria bacterium RIFCSPLOWO2_12_FULL_46_10]|uniref:Four helix bundle protein n=1 Tax=Candidatus Uhrbacteria bacterium RIFCSPLOWO2_01_FULL_47_25 TaxID=1802402 RepID=A0A1F7UWS2_9BACT|nr:MAG: hypothetical protein UX68_C0004G0004 [Parcubacteria group bacterium GW2011_GWA2_46_9]OGL60348.1 MAG: four helix bundle protein [Candidatus Uhrbacteria bacterium RIFCSPHIGHO2_01_FULL_46_23]OGL74946.1 MAG: four helix bundle protein [Candidatus Uhrbacteria bacterium RIFCSPHIGHO2_12_FULL_46_13]OGL82741.1 MAG: four helix bundle protein [Candidatus Uhrbacteria bacterium RIFCSPLOWO2_01_FULL_47_25]OGL84035.1 MAG: four helix bundle protein [Candidatus Uhrbacteria bacterium RIFCSPLOWO2_02_FULL_46
MTQITSTKQRPYDSEERTLQFAKHVSQFIRGLPKNITNIEYAKQLARSAGSVGANYIEANECLSRKDFAMRVKIAKKEAKESRYWLQLLEVSTPVDDKDRLNLIDEATQLMKIFGAVIERSN